MSAANFTSGKGVIFAIVLSFLAFTDVSAHGGGNWNAFRIDQSVDQVEKRVLKVQSDITNLILGQIVATDWPLPELARTENDLHSLKEEIDEILAHYLIDGMNLQIVENLRKEPRAGRAVAANQALVASIALIGRAAAAADQAAFTKDFYETGPTAHLYELLDAHRDRMTLYSILMSTQEQLYEPDE